MFIFIYISYGFCIYQGKMDGTGIYYINDIDNVKFEFFLVFIY